MIAFSMPTICRGSMYPCRLTISPTAWRKDHRGRPAVVFIAIRKIRPRILIHAHWNVFGLDQRNHLRRLVGGFVHDMAPVAPYGFQIQQIRIYFRAWLDRIWRPTTAAMRWARFFWRWARPPCTRLSQAEWSGVAWLFYQYVRKIGRIGCMGEMGTPHCPSVRSRFGATCGTARDPRPEGSPEHAFLL